MHEELLCLSIFNTSPEHSDQTVAVSNPLDVAVLPLGMHIFSLPNTDDRVDL